ncbi:MAG TPA: glycosyltransferase family 39 protein [Thermoanaerobaculia bacterium]|nr:glycosyltransferase family 39 protein [Thermoanaerobaculia bacterium]
MSARFLPWLLALALITIGFSQLDQYNVTWDEALGDFFFGQRYLSFFTTFDARYLDFASDPYPEGTTPDLRRSYFRMRPWEYWPVANTLAAATSRVVAAAGLADPFDGFHALNLILGALLVVAMYRFVERASSPLAAAAAVSLLVLMPRLVADLMANIKDFPEMVFFSLALLQFFRAYEGASAGGIVASGAIWGLALGTKANALFLPFIVIVHVIARGTEPWEGKERRLGLALFGAAVTGVLLMFAAWPWLWADPIARLRDNFTYLAYRSGHRPASAALIGPWTALAFTTPPLTLLLFAIALPLFLRRAIRREPAAVLLIAWTAVVAARVSLVAINFDGVRHFLEIFPPLAMMSGIACAELASGVTSRRAARAALVAVPVVASAVATLRVHPFESTYWNAFTGGLAGAQRRHLPQSSDYWAASYRLGLRWINENAPRGALLVVPIAGHAVDLVAPLRLRSDIRYVHYPRGGGPAAAAVRMQQMQKLARRHPVYVMFVPRRDWATELDTDCMRRLRPVREWSSGGAPVLLIYRYE